MHCPIETFFECENIIPYSILLLAWMGTVFLVVLETIDLLEIYYQTYPYVHSNKTKHHEPVRVSDEGIHL